MTVITKARIEGGKIIIHEMQMLDGPMPETTCIRTEVNKRYVKNDDGEYEEVPWQH